MIKVAICIPTFKRKVLLNKLIDSLEKLNLEYFKEHTIEIVVMDNDILKSAKEITNKKSKFEILYYSDPRKGLANVRNSIIDIAIKNNYTHIAFLDDDEELATKYWLEHLFKCMINNKADVVTGPVLTEYNQKVANWIIKSDYFNRKRHKTGSKMQYAGAGNLLIDMQIFKRNADLRFDTNFNSSGGEDTDFFYNLTKKGLKIIWCDEAVVKEPLVENRANFRYMINRSLNGGMIFTKCQLKYSKKPIFKKFSILSSSLIKIIIYLASSFLIPKRRLNYFFKAISQAGRFIAIFKKQLDMYN